MSKQLIFITSVLAVLAVCHAAVKQDGLYNCAGAQQLGKSATDNNCCQLCACMGMQNRAFSAQAIKNYCIQQCRNCVAAANDPKQCPKAGASKALPEVCARGLQFNAIVKGLVNKCVDIYSRDSSSLRKVAGC